MYYVVVYDVTIGHTMYHGANDLKIEQVRPNDVTNILSGLLFPKDPLGQVRNKVYGSVQGCSISIANALEITH